MFNGYGLIVLLNQNEKELELESETKRRKKYFSLCLSFFPVLILGGYSCIDEMYRATELFESCYKMY